MITIHGKYKNILFRGIYLSGGAPLSSYQYLNILKQDGHTVTIVFQEGKENYNKLYQETFDHVILDKYFGFYVDNHQFLSLYKALRNEYKALKANTPDLVICLGHLNGWFYSRFCSALQIPCVMFVAGGDLEDGRYLLKNSKFSCIICFSEENKDVLVDYNNEKQISVISNRIKAKKVFNDTETHYNFTSNQPIQILLTSRIDKDKYCSVEEFINLINSVAAENRKISLVIAGDGNRFGDLKKYAENINNPHLNVDLVGHIDNLTPYFEKSHIVVGKGRSVLEPIMMNRVGCVIGDDGRIEVCTTKNFDNIYHYNFSGRNLQKENPEAELTGLIESLVDGSFDFADFKETVEIIDSHYSSEYLADKFYAVLDRIDTPQKTCRFVSPLMLFIKFIFLKIFRKLKKKGLK